MESTISCFKSLIGSHWQHIVTKAKQYCNFEINDEDYELLEKYNFIFSAQRYEWDCGIACLEMVYTCFLFFNYLKLLKPKQVLKWKGLSTTILYEHCISKSLNPVWTIDLFCFIRGEIKTEAVMYTRYVGIDPSHCSIDWYSKTFTIHEYKKVKTNFDMAKLNDWKIIEVS